MPKRNSGSGFDKNKHVATPKNLNFQALGSLDNYVHVLLQTLPTKHDLEPDFRIRGNRLDSTIFYPWTTLCSFISSEIF